METAGSPCLPDLHLLPWTRPPPQDPHPSCQGNPLTAYTLVPVRRRPSLLDECAGQDSSVSSLSGAAAVMRCLLFLNSFLLRSQREARAADIIGHLNTSVRVNFEATKQWPFLPHFKLMLLTKDLFCTGDCNSHSLVTCLSFSNCCCYSAIPFETVYLYYMTRYDLYTLYICSFNIIWLVIQ